mmetsp:Transcript_14825/g.16426  ORF Transcript_14825/g.16426 Transcript_14825/m.16426 type:complete len:415 (+) Transcript_14825:81-1325(+)
MNRSKSNGFLCHKGKLEIGNHAGYQEFRKKQEQERNRTIYGVSFADTSPSFRKSLASRSSFREESPGSKLSTPNRRTSHYEQLTPRITSGQRKTPSAQDLDRMLNQYSSQKNLKGSNLFGSPRSENLAKFEPNSLHPNGFTPEKTPRPSSDSKKVKREERLKKQLERASKRKASSPGKPHTMRPNLDDVNVVYVDETTAVKPGSYLSFKYPKSVRSHYAKDFANIDYQRLNKMNKIGHVLRQNESSLDVSSPQKGMDLLTTKMLDFQNVTAKKREQDKLAKSASVTEFFQSAREKIELENTISSAQKSQTRFSETGFTSRSFKDPITSLNYFYGETSKMRDFKHARERKPQPAQLIRPAIERTLAMDTLPDHMKSSYQKTFMPYKFHRYTHDVDKNDIDLKEDVKKLVRKVKLK